MPDLHEPPQPTETTDPETIRYNSRLGLGLFGVYLFAYGVYVILNAFWPKTMAVEATFGLNVAVVYGLGLIVGAFVLALAYALLCKSAAKEPS